METFNIVIFIIFLIYEELSGGDVREGIRSSKIR